MSAMTPVFLKGLGSPLAVELVGPPSIQGLSLDSWPLRSLEPPGQPQPSQPETKTNSFSPKTRAKSGGRGKTKSRLIARIRLVRNSSISCSPPFGAPFQKCSRLPPELTRLCEAVDKLASCLLHLSTQDERAPHLRPREPSGCCNGNQIRASSGADAFRYNVDKRPSCRA